ncbi:MAG: electron transfer flavoprotein beta subunit/FixA family protein [Deltaproteobacteria bacterium]|nr:MAG: electron transfer flavoprotein beta subunit/FixA family protein [Deltaproteobacteria bacterium]
MKILVCIKQVVCSESSLELNPDGKWIQETDSTEYRMNRFDEYALEEALLIKEANPGVTIDVVSVGPDRIKDAVKKGLSKGADNGVHICNEESGYCPPRKIAQQIADYAGKQSYDLILTGVMAEDDMLCQVGPMTAALLSIPCAVSVIKQEMDMIHRIITVQSEMESGKVEEVVLSLPALLTIQTGINQPRYPSLYNILRANSQELIVVTESLQGNPPDKEILLSLDYPAKSSKICILEGSAEEKAEQLLTIFHNKSLLK